MRDHEVVIWYSSVWDEFRLQLKNVFGLPTFPLLNIASLVCQIRVGYSFSEASSVKQLQQATVPMLFIHGDADTFVPFTMLDVVYEACASTEKEKLVVHDAAHGAAADTDPELYWDTVTTFVGSISQQNQIERRSEFSERRSDCMIVKVNDENLQTAAEIHAESWQNSYSTLYYLRIKV